MLLFEGVEKLALETATSFKEGKSAQKEEKSTSSSKSKFFPRVSSTFHLAQVKIMSNHVKHN